jgi:acetyl-CoA carboxylase alpha subunit
MVEEFSVEQTYTLGNVMKELNKINKKIDSIEDKLNSKTDSLIELLRDIVSTNLKQNNITKSVVETVEPVTPDLYYTISEDFIFIKGKKTYQNKDKIKSALNGIWNKEKNCWSFKKYTNFEEKLKEVFPDIIEGQ